jgi:hypothetical protein
MALLGVGYSGDNAVCPRDAEAQFAAAPHADRTFAMIQGADHYGIPLAGVGKDTRAEVLALLGSWLRARFPAA